MASSDPPDNFDWSELLDLSGTVDIQPAATISFMITRRQRARLSELGFSDEVIFNMKPADAHDILERSFGRKGEAQDRSSPRASQTRIRRPMLPA